MAPVGVRVQRPTDLQSGRMTSLTSSVDWGAAGAGRTGRTPVFVPARPSYPRGLRGPAGSVQFTRKCSMLWPALTARWSQSGMGPVPSHTWPLAFM